MFHELTVDNGEWTTPPGELFIVNWPLFNA